MSTIIWHNPTCSKSRMALQILIDANITPLIRLYLQNPPSETEIKDLLSLLKKPALDITRKTEFEFKSLKPQILANEDSLIKVLIKNPILIERPIVITKKRAIIARPPSLLEGFLKI